MPAALLANLLSHLPFGLALLLRSADRTDPFKYVYFRLPAATPRWHYFDAVTAEKMKTGICASADGILPSWDLTEDRIWPHTGEWIARHGAGADWHYHCSTMTSHAEGL